MGLALSVLGLYGLLVHAAVRRTREIGIRIALGATRKMILNLLLREGMHRPRGWARRSPWHNTPVAKPTF